MKKTPMALVALCAAFVSGCGTVCNVVSGDRYPYGGVGRDFAILGGYQGTSDDKSQLPLLIVVSSELLASFIGDTLLLPFTQRPLPVNPYNSVDGHNDESTLSDGPHNVEPVLVIQREPDVPAETAVPKQ